MLLSSAWIWVALVLPFAISLASPLFTVDLAYGVRAGQLMLEHGEIVRVDVFSFSTWCRPWLNQQWAAHVAFAGTYGALGWLGLALLRAALATAVVASTYLACRACKAVPRAAAWLALLSWLPHFGSQLRAQSFGLLCFAVVLWIVAGRVEHPRRMAWAIPVVLVWANAHGSFPMGLVVLAFATLEDRVAGRTIRRSLLVTGLASLATFVTPFGPRVWSYVADLSTDPFIREAVVEWQPPWASLPVAIAFSASAALGAWAFVRYRRAVPWPAWVQLGVFTALAASSMRTMFFFAIVLSLTLARLPWARREPRRDPRHRGHALLVAMLAAVAVVALVRWLPYPGPVPPASLVRYAPQALTTELRSILRPGEPFANPSAWGSWFELELPGHPLFVDSRFEVMPVETVRASWLIARAGPGWERELDALPVRVVAVDRVAQAPLATALASSGHWRRVYSDADGLIYVQIDGESAPPLPACAAAPD